MCLLGINIQFDVKFISLMGGGGDVSIGDYYGNLFGVKKQ